MPRTRTTLLSRIKALDDGASWEEFDQLYRPLLIRYATDRVLSAEEAEDIAQQCMAAVAGGIQNFQRKVSFRGWLRGMVDHKVADRLKAKQSEVQARTADLDCEQGREDSAALIWERQWNKTHLLYCLRRVRDQITPLTYEAFNLYVIEELPVAEIAEHLGMTPNQVYVAKHRVIGRLKDRWADMADGLV